MSRVVPKRQVSLNLHGLPVIVSDTAGLRETNDSVEAAGISLARRAGAEATLRLLILDVAELCDEGGGGRPPPSAGLINELLGKSPQNEAVRGAPPVLVLNKVDTRPELVRSLRKRASSSDGSPCWQVPLDDPLLAPLRRTLGDGTEGGALSPAAFEAAVPGLTCHAVSCVDESRTGIDALVRVVSGRVATVAGVGSRGRAARPHALGSDSQAEAPPITRARHREHLKRCLECLDSFSAVAAPEDGGGSHGIELAAEDLRQAALSLGRVCGRVDVEDILDVIFRDFCIGK
jgi:tRNA modification GTPase